MKKISYLVALFNKSEYVVEAISSILADCSFEYDLQICIVDDGSTDDSLEKVILNYGNDPRVKIYQFLVNRGKVAAYNQAYLMSDGDFVSVFGADDVVLKGRNSILFNKCIDSGKSVYGGLIKYVERTGEEGFSYPIKEISFQENILGNRLSGGCGMLHRSHADLVFPIPEYLKFEDWWMSFHLIKNKSVVTIQELVTRYRIHGGNDNGSEFVDYDSMCRDYERHIDYLNSFSPYIDCQSDIDFLLRAMDIRNCFLGRKGWASLVKKPYDKSWLKLLLLNFFGPKLMVYWLNKKIALFSKK
jgi:glycosyltransferase involved in cell wall biosynthesis